MHRAVQVVDDENDEADGKWVEVKGYGAVRNKKNNQAIKEK